MTDLQLASILHAPDIEESTLSNQYHLYVYVILEMVNIKDLVLKYTKEEEKIPKNNLKSLSINYYSRNTKTLKITFLCI